MQKYRICYWCNRNFDSIPSGTIYTEYAKDTAYEKFYEILNQSNIERIEMYKINSYGEEELIDRLTAVN